VGANQRTGVPNTTYGGLFSRENLYISLIIHVCTCTIENSAVMDLVSPLTKPVLCLLVAEGFLLFSVTHTQSHVTGKSLMLTLRH